MKVKYKVYKRDNETIIEIVEVEDKELNRVIAGTRIATFKPRDIKELIRRHIERMIESLRPREELLGEYEEDIDVKVE